MILSCILNTYLCLKALAVVQPRGWDVAPFVMAWFGQAIHAPFSAGYHTFMCICPTTANAWRRADLSMIFIMSACGTFALSYFTLGLRGALLWSLLDACIGVAGIRNVLKLQPKQKLSRQGILGMITLANLGYYIPMATRAVMTLHAPSLYAAVNMSAVAAAQSEFGPQPTGQSHQSALTSRAYSSNSSALSYSTVNAWMLPEVYVTVLLFVCHVAGATAYALHWPQRQFPRIFDMIVSCCVMLCVHAAYQ